MSPTQSAPAAPLASSAVLCGQLTNYGRTTCDEPATGDNGQGCPACPAHGGPFALDEGVLADAIYTLTAIIDGKRGASLSEDEARHLLHVIATRRAS